MTANTTAYLLVLSAAVTGWGVLTRNENMTTAGFVACVAILLWFIGPSE